MNTQAPEKKARREDGLIEVHSIFYTIQGEGPFCGTPAVFIRLAGCNLQCPGCDTEYTQDRYLRGIHQIASDVNSAFVRYPINAFQRSGGYLVVITGGEPFRQDIGKLCHLLVENGYFVQVETNGTLPAPDILYNRDIATRSGIYVVVSPKTGTVNRTVESVACAYKYVATASSISSADGLPEEALRHKAHPFLARPPKTFMGPIYLQPMDMGVLDGPGKNSNKNNLHACLDSCMRYGYVLQLQTHKIIGVP